MSSTTWHEVFRNVSRRSWRVWQRDVDVYRTTWLVNFIPPLLEPVFYVLAFGLGLGSLIREVSYVGSSISYLRFMVPGVIAVAIMFWAYFETTYASFVRMYYQRTFDAIVATPLLVEDVIAGEWLWGATKSLMAATIMLGVMTAFGLVVWPAAALVIPLSVLGGLMFSALGLITTAISPKIDFFNVPIFVLVFPDVPVQRDVLPGGHPAALGFRHRVDPPADARVVPGAGGVPRRGAAVLVAQLRLPGRRHRGEHRPGARADATETREIGELLLAGRSGATAIPTDRADPRRYSRPC
jgi:Nod factor-specific ABC transporter NodJ protein